MWVELEQFVRLGCVVVVFVVVVFGDGWWEVG